jgi:hypothetical protein
MSIAGRYFRTTLSNFAAGRSAAKKHSQSASLSNPKRFGISFALCNTPLSTRAHEA